MLYGWKSNTKAFDHIIFSRRLFNHQDMLRLIVSWIVAIVSHRYTIRGWQGSFIFYLITIYYKTTMSLQKNLNKVNLWCSLFFKEYSCANIFLREVLRLIVFSWNKLFLCPRIIIEKLESQCCYDINISILDIYPSRNKNWKFIYVCKCW